MAVQIEITASSKMERTGGRQALFHMANCISDTVHFLLKTILFLFANQDTPSKTDEEKPSIIWNYVAIALVILAVILSVALMLSRRLQSAFPYNVIVAAIIIILFIYGMGFFFYISDKFHTLYSLLITLAIAIIVLLITFNLKTMQLGGFILFFTLACVFAVAGIVLLAVKFRDRLFRILGGACLAVSTFFIMFITGCELGLRFRRGSPTSAVLIEMFVYFFEMIALFFSIYLCFMDPKAPKGPTAIGVS
ncbi:unnamed protein product [Trichobilharzia szidati]|nr:unnamed protein product [Trichobilharzia szidati]